MEKFRTAIIEFAKTQIGTIEESPGKVKYNDWYYPDNHQYHKNPRGWHWCGTFCSYIYHFAAIQVGCINPLTSGHNFNDTIHYIPAFRNWAIRNKKITDNPKQGDFVIFDWNKDGMSDHIGIFVKWLDANRFECIEGNTAPGNDSAGGRVMLRIRSKASVQCFVDVIG